MPNKRKISIVNSLKQGLRKTEVIVFTDYQGLTHHQLEDLRQLIKQQKANFKIVKNSLFKIAASSSFKLSPSTLKLTGPTAILLTNTSNLSPIKIIYDKGKELKSLKIKGGIWEKEIIAKEKIIRLATLPSRQILLAQLISQINAPNARLVFSLKGNLQKLVLVLSKINKRKVN